MFSEAKNLYISPFQDTNVSRKKNKSNRVPTTDAFSLLLVLIVDYYTFATGIIST